jgi:hypothetical protein
MRRSTAAMAAAGRRAGGGMGVSTVAAGVRRRSLLSRTVRPLRRRQGDHRAAAVAVDLQRRQFSDAVRAQRAPQVDGLAAGAAQR